MKVVSLRSDAPAGSEPSTGRAPASAMIEIDHVSQRFQTSGKQSHLALSDINLSIADGAFVSILGPAFFDS